MFEVRGWMFDERGSIIDFRGSMFDVRGTVLDVRSSMFDDRGAIVERGDIRTHPLPFLFRRHIAFFASTRQSFVDRTRQSFVDLRSIQHVNAVKRNIGGRAIRPGGRGNGCRAKGCHSGKRVLPRLQSS